MMDGIPDGIGNGRQLMLQALEFHHEIVRVSQGAPPAVLFIEIVGIGLSLDLDELSRALRFVATVVMVGDVVLRQAPAARLLQRRT
jgi:hypothetical protein